MDFGINILLLSCAALVFVDSAPPFVAYSLLFKLRGIGRYRLKILKALNKKPLNCAVCLSFWFALIFALIFNINFIFYIVAVPIVTKLLSKI